ncbi:MAG: methionine ABC transporter ATP-binding protein [Desulfovibrio sp.]|nr:methionine ABC transporter ATP-binding protein [Desulfovibrio sp.]
MAPLLDIQGLTTAFPSRQGWLAAVDGLDLTVEPGEVLGLVGESGCGKSLTALSVLGLLPPPGRVRSGRIVYQGRDLLSLPADELRAVRGHRIAMIFQEPMTSLNPVFTVGRQVAEQVSAHLDVSTDEAWNRAVAMLGKVGIPQPASRARDYPHQLSGGQRQRVMIAMALVNSPHLLLADEPTTALDVTIQAQILALLARLKAELGLAVLFITHNLGIVAQTADRVAVMYAGLMVELAPTPELFRHPGHPYTVGLLNSVPRLDFSHPPGEILSAIEGHLPAAPPSGCLFRDRCPLAHDRCREEPSWVEVVSGHQVRCWNYV